MRAFLMFLCTVFMAAAPASARPVADLGATAYEVVGLTPPDSLSIRTGIDEVAHFSEAKVIGRIPHDGVDVLSKGVAITLNGARWVEIVYQGVSGWVNARYLRTGISDLPRGLNCSGFEPSWELRIRGTEATLGDYASADTGKTYAASGPHAGQNRSGLSAVHLTARDRQSTVIVLLQATGQCQIAGHLEYALEAYLLGPDPESGPRQGCCSFAP